MFKNKESSLVILSVLFTAIYLINTFDDNQEFGSIPIIVMFIAIFWILRRKIGELIQFIKKSIDKGFAKLTMLINQAKVKGFNFNKDGVPNPEPEECWISEKGHNGIALLKNKEEETWFYANSQITVEKGSKFQKFNSESTKKKYVEINITPEIVKNIQEEIKQIMRAKDFIICSESSHNSTVLPYAIVTPELEFEYISDYDSNLKRQVETREFESLEEFDTNSEYRHRVHCSEKKILHYILRNYDLNYLKESTLTFFTESHPCTSCLAAMKLEKAANTFLDIKSYYKDLLKLNPNVVLNGLTNGEKTIINKGIDQISEINRNRDERLFNKALNNPNRD
ncbi:hypothetical protein SSIL_0818 [Solibacillus silvestris StLB046]|uniref:Uncharacterized protein n=1 Tax=Solibacillus silvestris (strain StLB046) TaxID=1002809 RepID=F2F0D1_SOLSS|nr:hypothetical protein [Solibacillus silvestris]BAK15241.1 hypothetical protein SSIL_0818 [Solibacillus silvestris StLB046]